MDTKPSPSPGGADDKRRAKTEEGNRARSMNALKYGFFSAKALLPGESLEEYMVFHDNLLHQFCPRNLIESFILEKYAAMEWRLKRLPEIEAGIFARYGISVQGNQCGSAFALVNSVQTDNILNQLARYEATLHKYSLKYLELLRSLRKDRWGGDATGIVEAQVVEAPPGQACDS